MIAENQPLSPQSFEQQQNPEAKRTAVEILASMSTLAIAQRAEYLATEEVAE